MYGQKNLPLYCFASFSSLHNFLIPPTAFCSAACFDLFFIPLKRANDTEPEVFDLLVKDLCRDIYDLYAEYEDEEEEDQFPVPPCLLLSPTKHLALNINVGGTVS